MSCVLNGGTLKFENRWTVGGILGKRCIYYNTAKDQFFNDPRDSPSSDSLSPAAWLRYVPTRVVPGLGRRGKALMMMDLRIFFR